MFGVRPRSLDEVSLSSLDLELQQRRYEADGEIASLIGEVKLRRWKEYDATIGERQQVRMLRLELMDTSEPLESDEAESLIRAIHEETLLIERDAKAMMPEPVSGEEREGPTFVVRENLAEFEAESVRRVLKASEKVLSPGQLKTFRRMLEQQREVERTMEQMSRAQMEALK